MINIKKLKHNSLLDDFDLLTEFARTDTRKEINLDTELPELNDINLISSSHASNIKISKINPQPINNNYNNITEELNDFENNDTLYKITITEDNNNIPFHNELKDDLKTEITNNFNQEIKEEITNNFKKEIKEDIENILTTKLTDNLESNKLIEESLMNFDPTESIMEDLDLIDMDNYKSDILKREYNLKSKQQKIFNKQDINNIYRYLIKYRIKIKKKLLKKNIINENLDCSDKLLFSLYLNLLFDDIILQ